MKLFTTGFRAVFYYWLLDKCKGWRVLKNAPFTFKESGVIGGVYA